MTDQRSDSIQMQDREAKCLLALFIGEWVHGRGVKGVGMRGYSHSNITEKFHLNAGGDLQKAAWIDFCL